MASVLDRFHARESAVHALDPRVKLLAVVAFGVGTALLPTEAGLADAVGLALTVAVAAAARLGPGFALRRSFIAAPFLLAGLSVIFAGEGRALWEGALFGRSLAITEEGLLRFGALVARSWLAVQAAILLTATTAFPDLTHALKHLRVPGVLVAIISFMYRYLFVLVEEAQRMLRARAARSAARPGQRAGGSIPWRARVAGSMAGQLLVRSMERGDRVYMAMAARGYRGHLLTMNRHTMDGRDWRAALIVALALVMIQMVGRTP